MFVMLFFVVVFVLSLLFFFSFLFSSFLFFILLRGTKELLGGTKEVVPCPQKEKRNQTDFFPPLWHEGRCPVPPEKKRNQTDVCFFKILNLKCSLEIPNFN